MITEIDHPDQRRAIEEAIQRGWLQITGLEDATEPETYTEANEVLGRGESACLARAMQRNWVLATHDSKGAKWKNVVSVPGNRC